MHTYEIDRIKVGTILECQADVRDISDPFQNIAFSRNKDYSVVKLNKDEAGFTLSIVLRNNFGGDVVLNHDQLYYFMIEKI